MFDWFETHREAAGWVAAFSAGAFLFALAAVPRLVVRIPADYFAPGAERRTRRVSSHTAPRLFLALLRNLIGFVLLMAGIAMLFLPGQGILTILAALALLDFPGKRRLERWLVSRPPVLRTINRMRLRAGKAPLDI